VNTPKNLVIVLLAATTIGGAVLAWRQYGDLVELRATAMKRDERAEMQKRVWGLEKLNRELQDKLAASREPAGNPERLAAGPEGGEERRGPERGGRGDPRGRGDNVMQQATAIRDLMNKPEVQAMLSLQQKAAIEQRYAALFKSLNLQPDQIEKLKSLLAERTTTTQDVLAAAREQGVDPRENPTALRKMNADAQNVINNSIKATIGDAGFAQLSTFEKTLPQRNLVNDLQQRLSYTDAPLNPAQTEQLVSILAANAPPRTPNPAAGQPQGGMPPGGGRGPGPGPGGGPMPGGPSFDGRGGDLGGMIAGVLGGGPGADMGRGSGAATVTPAAVAQAQGILTPTQLAALQQIQQQQQTQQQLRQLVNDTLQANQPQNPKSGPAPGGATPGRRPGGG